MGVKYMGFKLAQSRKPNVIHQNKWYILKSSFYFQDFKLSFYFTIIFRGYDIRALSVPSSHIVFM